MFRKYLPIDRGKGRAKISVSAHYYQPVRFLPHKNNNLEISLGKGIDGFVK
jgi:hypothetical protein